MKFLWNAACYELLLARNFGEQAHTLRIDFDFDADFADLFSKCAATNGAAAAM